MDLTSLWEMGFINDEEDTESGEDNGSSGVQFLWVIDTAEDIRESGLLRKYKSDRILWVFVRSEEVG
ncbi:hypothetical protein ACLOJK_027228 [Asimina triloba]